MLDVFFTVDVEIWCGGWKNIEDEFSDSFQRYVYGPGGRFGLPYTLDLLQDHGMTGVFFVEPLFARRFGMEPLAEIVHQINRRKQEVQLHLHPEWVVESADPIFNGQGQRKQYLRQFTYDEQVTLLSLGKDLLAEAGGGTATAFRAGSFGFNTDTLKALAKNGIQFDSSYNGSVMGQSSGVLPGKVAVEPIRWDGVFEYPLTVFRDGTNKLRHAQVTACSFAEMEGLLWRALEQKRRAFVILSHNFELLNAARMREDGVVVRRLNKLFSFLDRNRDSFRVRGFQNLEPTSVDLQPEPLTSPIWRTAARILEQVYRRRYG